MVASRYLKTRVSEEMKQRVLHAAQQQLLTESIWLRRVIHSALGVDALPEMQRRVHEKRASGCRISVRLRPDDHLLLLERASARSMPLATYVSVLMRAHIRGLPPLPKDELNALKRMIAELGAIGRNLNQLARAANQGERVTGPSREDVRAMLRVSQALRDHVKGLMKANLKSWECGHAQGSD